MTLVIITNDDKPSPPSATATPQCPNCPQLEAHLIPGVEKTPLQVTPVNEKTPEPTIPRTKPMVPQYPKMPPVGGPPHTRDLCKAFNLRPPSKSKSAKRKPPDPTIPQSNKPVVPPPPGGTTWRSIPQEIPSPPSATDSPPSAHDCPVKRKPPRVHIALRWRPTITPGIHARRLT
ncbi:hypothetical protein B0T26DRAFT_437741 [Lasiosphaeria miniovina]|uniref:Uncharacterized protein n=1 Tax=Lasiosphaeria miniovina TaxID=1954250 RepID=A0AA39ZYA9_9PEZI|nr:uncharacterized protein B0T26DRAFT_437741 [Lasiosphaeria miniovina]KAK0705887.1 hypothetical protein B0T26DRAFT_437741 [Lasiosphaeria miniovina]